MIDPRNNVDGFSLGGGSQADFRDCNATARDIFDNSDGGGIFGDGDFLPPGRLFRTIRSGCLAVRQQAQMAAYKKSGGVVSVPAPTPTTSSAAAVDYTPLIYLVAILIVVRVVL